MSKLTPAQRAALALGPSYGGLAVRDKTPPAACPLCGWDLTGYTWMAYLGHRGLHTVADRYYHGDMVQAARALKSHDLDGQ